MKKISVFLLIAAMVFALAGAGLVAEQKTIVVGNKNFTEQYIVGQLMKQVLEANGYKVSLKSDLSSMVLRQGMETEDIDVAADYTGTAWMVHLGRELQPWMKNEELYGLVRGTDYLENNFVWLKPMWNNNTYALAVWPEFAEKHGLENLSDLADLYNQKDGKIDTFIDIEFSKRPDGLPALEKTYGFEIAEGSLMVTAPGGSLQALANKQVDVAMVFGTDAAIAEHGWVVLNDDKGFFPPYDLAAYAKESLLEEFPGVGEALNELVACFPGKGEPYPGKPVDQSIWQDLNAKVDVEKMDADEAAREFLEECGLVG